MSIAISLKRVEFLLCQIQKLDKKIYIDTADDLVPVETSEEAVFNDRTIQGMAEFYFRSRDHPSDESGTLTPQTSQPPSGAIEMQTKLPTLKLTKFCGDKLAHILKPIWDNNSQTPNFEHQPLEKFQY